MKHTDEYIKEIFSKKLGEYESHVSPELWSNIASQLPQAAATTAAVAAKTISAKLIWTAAVVAVTVASVVTYVVVQSNKEEKVVAVPSTAQVIYPNQESDNVNEQAVETAPASSANDIKENRTTPLAKEQTTKPANKTNSAAGKDLVPHSIPVRIDTPTAPSSPVISKQQNTPAGNSNSNTPAQPEKKVEEKEVLTAKFTTAPVNKEELRYFFMPQYTNGASYLWDFGNGATSTEMSPVYTFDDEGKHEVTLTLEGKDGEKKVIVQTISTYKPGKIVAPNVFTPNGDGQNDFFDVLAESVNVVIQQIVVFDSLGKQVFESNGEILWDGKNPQGVALPVGEYQYFISGTDKEGKRIEKKGSVSLKQ